MSDITINIRASADPSLRNAFRPLEESVRRGRAMVAREVDGMTSDRTAAVRRATSNETSAINQLRRDRERANQAILHAQRGSDEKRYHSNNLQTFDRIPLFERASVDIIGLWQSNGSSRAFRFARPTPTTSRGALTALRPSCPSERPA
jgi:hypothetical protein